MFALRQLSHLVFEARMWNKHRPRRRAIAACVHRDVLRFEPSDLLGDRKTDEVVERRSILVRKRYGLLFDGRRQTKKKTSVATSFANHQNYLNRLT
jgi:hypothetical protein